MPSDAAASPDRAALLDAVDARFDTTIEELVALASIPSISAAGHDPAQVRASAEATAELLRAAGLDDVRFLEIEGAHPYVTGQDLSAGADAVTVLLYAHHDVQSVGTPARWTSDPFIPTERDGRLYGRGCADDKAGVLAHLAAIHAWRDAAGALPVNVKVIIEGEEEIGSPHLPEFLAAHGPELDADVIVLADLANFAVGHPSLTYALRGMMDTVVTVKALAQPVHSGMWGGPFPDALTGTARLIASLHDDRGAIAVEGFTDDVRPMTDDERARLLALDEDIDALRREVRAVAGLELVGDPDHSVLERLWMQPTITPTGMDVPDVVHASNTLLNEITTKLSIRLAPGQDPERAQARLAAHLQAHAPFGMEITVEAGEGNAAWVTTPGGPAWDAARAAFEVGYGHPVADVGCGGSIPFVEPFSTAMGGAACLLIGVEDPGSNAHGEDESLHLEDFRSACRSVALLFAELADRAEAVKQRGN